MNGFVRRLAQLTALAAVVLLALGGLTTTYRAGMADPGWPSVPWFLPANWQNYDRARDFGFLLEHSHRLSGFVIGALASILALAAWISGTNKVSRIAGLFAILALLSAYGDLHRRMMAAMSLRQSGQGFEWPHASIYSTLACAGALITIAALHACSRQPGRWVRFAATLALVGVMIQGLLGGLRVFLDSALGLKQTLGIELATVHGIFAQVVFALLCCIPQLCRPAPSNPGWAKYRTPAFALLSITFVQLIWAAWIRHTPTPLGQRLHLMTAFAVMGVAVWVAGLIRREPMLRRYSAMLVVAVAVQIVLGVEAWMGKFAASGPYAAMPPEFRPITTGSAITRTLHQLVGTAILAGSAVLSLKIVRGSRLNESGGELEQQDPP